MADKLLQAATLSSSFTRRPSGRFSFHSIHVRRCCRKGLLSADATTATLCSATTRRSAMQTNIHLRRPCCARRRHALPHRAHRRRHRPRGVADHTRGAGAWRPGTEDHARGCRLSGSRVMSSLFEGIPLCGSAAPGAWALHDRSCHPLPQASAATNATRNRPSRPRGRKGGAGLG